jgi:hypothetical protein
MNRRFARWPLVIADGFVAITAVAGGVELVVAGDTRFSRSLLVDTPFSDFAVPGVILAVAVGGSAAYAAISLITRRDSRVSFVAGIVLAGWICCEVLMLNQPHPTWIEAMYLSLGVAMAVGAYRLSEVSP